MVLQRAPVSAVVWGFAPPGTKVTTTFGTQKIVSEADGNSTWRTSLMPTAASATAHTISFSASTGETATLSDGARSSVLALLRKPALQSGACVLASRRGRCASRLAQQAV